MCQLYSKPLWTRNLKTYHCDITYINIILIYLTTLEDHIHNVHAVLTRLLYVKAEECEFHKNTITFLGYVITQGGWMDQSKVKVVTTNHYCKGIKNFPGICQILPLIHQKLQFLGLPYHFPPTGKPQKDSMDWNLQSSLWKTKNSFYHSTHS